MYKSGRQALVQNVSDIFIMYLNSPKRKNSVLHAHMCTMCAPKEKWFHGCQLGVQVFELVDYRSYSLQLSSQIIEAIALVRCDLVVASGGDWYHHPHGWFHHLNTK